MVWIIVNPGHSEKLRWIMVYRAPMYRAGINVSEIRQALSHNGLRVYKTIKMYCAYCKRQNIQKHKLSFIKNHKICRGVVESIHKLRKI